MEQMTDYYPYENSAVFDTERSLRWANETILHAIRYYLTVCGVTIDYENMLTELRAGKLRVIQALLFGALKTADAKITIKRYGDIYKSDNLEQYVTVVIDGMAQYLPAASTTENNAPLDPEWPDTQDEIKKKTSVRTGGSGSGSVKKSAKNSSRKR